MSRARAALARLVGLVSRTRRERELDDEVRFHLEMRIEDNLKTGMTPAQARASAFRHFGAVEPMKEDYRAGSGFTTLESLIQDVRYASRVLRRSPSYAVTSIATLALAIGASTAMFSVLDTVLLRPLPYDAPDELVMLWTTNVSQNVREGRTAFATVDDWRTRGGAFADIAVFDPVVATFATADTTERIGVMRVSPNFFPLLGIRPARGRFFSPAEADERQSLAVISHRLWQSRFGGAPDAIDAAIQLDGRRSRVVGVLPADFQFADEDVWEPHTMFPDWDTRRVARGAGPWLALGRLRHEDTGCLKTPGVLQCLDEIARRLAAASPAADPRQSVGIVPLSAAVVGARPRLALWMLAAVVLSVLVIAAANVASVSLIRGFGRARELALRSVLGATRSRILRQLVAESAVLGAAAGVAGAAFAQAIIATVRTLGPANVPRLGDIALDGRVLAWALVISSVIAMCVGLAPALSAWSRGSRMSLGGDGPRAGSGPGARRIRRALVVGELALALTLLAGTALLVRSWWALQNIDPGFRAERVLSMAVSTTAFATPAGRLNFYEQVLVTLGSHRGIERVSVASELFIGNSPVLAVTAEGRSTPERLPLRRDEVSADFFRSVGARILRGRSFSSGDRPGSPLVAIVNEAMARRLWPGRDALGARFTFGAARPDSVWFTVVGIAGDMRREGLEREPLPQMFEALAQNPPRLAVILVRTASDDPLRMADSARAAIHRVDPDVPVYGVTSLEQQLERGLAPRRFQTWLVLGFSAIALVIAIGGIYGLVEYSVAMRTREIGVRVAVGADAAEIFRMIMSEGLTLTLAGLALGLAGAFAVARAGASLLFGITAADPFTFVGIPLLMIAITTVACYFPAKRAAAIEAAVALRNE